MTKTLPQEQEYDWELFGKGYVVAGVSGDLYRDGKGAWKWRGNIRTAITHKYFIDWLRANKIKPQAKGEECFWVVK